MVINVGVIKQIPDQPDTYKATVILTTDRVLPNPALQFDDPQVYNQIYGAFGIGPEYIFTQIILTGLIERLPAWEYSFMIKLAKKGSKLDIIRGPQGTKGDAGPPGPRGIQGEEGPPGPATITLGGDLADWIPTASDDHQRVVGLNTVPIPEPELPTDRDILMAQATLLLSQFPFDSTSDGTRVWVGDTQSPASEFYGGLVGVLFADEVISTRYEYDSAGLGDGMDIQIWSVVYLDGYIYATGLAIESPWLLKIDPADGTIVEPPQVIDSMAYVRTDGTYLYLLMPHAGKFNTHYWWVDPSDLTTLNAIDTAPSPYGDGFVDFAYDPDTGTGKIWLVNNGFWKVIRVDKVTHAIDFEVTDIVSPAAIEYGGGKLWLVDMSGMTSSYAYGYSYYYYPYYTGPQQVRVLDPSDGSITGTVTDTYNLINGSLRSVYDGGRGKMWVVVDSGVEFTSPRLVRVDTATEAVDGWCLLDIPWNMAITLAGNFLWVVDSPGGGGGGPVYTILKINPDAVDFVEPGVGTPADAILARIDSGSLAYQFTKKNVDKTVTAPLFSLYTVDLTDEVVLCQIGCTVRLPAAPVDGERHIIVDSAGVADSNDVSIYWWDPTYYGGGWVLFTAINTSYGATTVVYSAGAGRWFEV